MPVVARSEWIKTAAGEQFVTIEDSMSNVTASRGVLEPATPAANDVTKAFIDYARPIVGKLPAVGRLKAVAVKKKG